MGYKVESDFMHEGCRCVVIMTTMGHRCGYVGIDKAHPLYEVDYGQKVDCLKTADMNDVPMDKAGMGQILKGMTGEYGEPQISPEMFFAVHGGITFSGGAPSKYPVVSDLWWFGYDCAHYGDAKDLSVIENESERRIYSTFNDGIVRTKKYCEQECKNLAEQLSKVK